MRALVSITCLLLLVLCHGRPTEQEHKSRCLDLGFTSDLGCSDCESLLEYVKDEDLVQDCKSCCTPDQQVLKKYTSVTLEICPHRLAGLPQIKEFIDKKSKDFKKLKVSLEYGAYPRLVLKGPEGSDIMRIDNWKAAHIEEYLKDRLVTKTTK